LDWGYFFAMNLFDENEPTGNRLFFHPGESLGFPELQSIETQIEKIGRSLFTCEKEEREIAAFILFEKVSERNQLTAWL
jgi:hypothetical protein